MKLTRRHALTGPYSRTLRVMRLALLALFLFSVGLTVWNWKASQWWQLPIGLAAGYAASIVFWCVIPPRAPLPWPWPKLIAAYRAERHPEDPDKAADEE